MAFRDQFDGFEDIGPGSAGSSANGHASHDGQAEEQPGAKPGDQQQAPSALDFSLSEWDAVTAYEGEAKPQEWLIGNVLPRRTAGLVTAAGDTGKSFIALELGLRVTHGPLGSISLESPILGGNVASYGAAVFITAEDSQGSVHRRIRALDPDGQRQASRKFPLYVVPLPDAGGPFPIVADERGKVGVTRQFAALREQLRAIENLALIVFDPLQTLVTSVNVVEFRV